MTNPASDRSEPWRVLSDRAAAFLFPAGHGANGASPVAPDDIERTGGGSLGSDGGRRGAAAFLFPSAVLTSPTAPAHEGVGDIATVGGEVATTPPGPLPDAAPMTADRPLTEGPDDGAAPAPAVDDSTEDDATVDETPAPATGAAPATGTEEGEATVRPEPPRWTPRLARPPAPPPRTAPPPAPAPPTHAPPTHAPPTHAPPTAAPQAPSPPAVETAPLQAGTTDVVDGGSAPDAPVTPAADLGTTLPTGPVTATLGVTVPDSSGRRVPRRPKRRAARAVPRPTSAPRAPARTSRAPAPREVGPPRQLLPARTAPPISPTRRAARRGRSILGLVAMVILLGTVLTVTLVGAAAVLALGVRAALGS